MHVDGKGPKEVRGPGESPAEERVDPVCSPAARLERVRARLASGFYDKPEVMARTALLILKSGDLRGAL